MSGYLVCAAPIISKIGGSGSGPTAEEFGVGAATQSFVTNKQLLSKGADATERIMGSYKDVNELVGYTGRVFQMFQV